MPLEAPNYTVTPNDLFDALPDLAYAELKVALVLIRQTFGFHRGEVRVTITQLSAMTGLSRNAVVLALPKLEERDWICREVDPNNPRKSQLVKLLVQSEALVKQLDQSGEVGLPIEPVIGQVTSPLLGVLNKAKCSKQTPKESPPTPPKGGGSREWTGEIPVPLQDGTFGPVWLDEWLPYKREDKRKMVTQRSGDMALKRLEDMGPVRAVAALRHSIAQGWTGFFEPDGATAQAKPKNEFLDLMAKEARDG